MKKTVLFLTVFCMLFAGCANKAGNDPAPSPNAGTEATEKSTDTPTHQEANPTATPEGAADGLLSRMYIDIIKSGDYFMKAKVEGETGINEFAVSVSPDSTAMETETDGVLYTVLIREGVTYMINHDSQMIITSSAEVANSASNMAGDALSTEGLIFEAKGNGSFSGESLQYEEYKTTAGDTTMRFFFRQNALVGIESVSDGATTTYVIEEISAGHRSNMHVIPESYQLLDMAALGG
ncbi:MAG: hypothetical protein E7408_07355 [Ruminococcaceae bacterium]|nr:hypothetical protein [Oscillospiraceae bacterium]